MFVFARVCLVAGIAILTATHSTFAEDSGAETLLKPWVDAMERFSKARDAAKETLIKSLETAEEKARATGDLEKVNLIKQERASLEERDELPTSIKTLTYSKSIDAAKTNLKNAAQKAKANLLRQKFDTEANAVEMQLVELLGQDKTDNVVTQSGKLNTVGLNPPDSRVYWIEDREKGNEFRWIQPKEWIESTHDGTNKRFTWREIGRTAKFVELHDPVRSLGLRLLAESSDKSEDYKPAGSSAFVTGVVGKWNEDSKDVIYLSDLQELSHKTWNYNNWAWFGWGKNGQIPSTEKESMLIYLANRPSPKGIFTHPAPKDFAMVDYEIGRLRKQVFRAKFGVADNRNFDAGSKLKFIVIGDGKRLFTSEPTNKCGQAFECEVKIRNVDHLELRVECSDAADCAYAVWYEPRISNK